jgi:hypothetical protein
VTSSTWVTTSPSGLSGSALDEAPAASGSDRRRVADERGGGSRYGEPGDRTGPQSLRFTKALAAAWTAACAPSDVSTGGNLPAVRPRCEPVQLSCQACGGVALVCHPRAAA